MDTVWYGLFDRISDIWMWRGKCELDCIIDNPVELVIYGCSVTSVDYVQP